MQTYCSLGVVAIVNISIAEVTKNVIITVFLNLRCRKFMSSRRERKSKFVVTMMRKNCILFVSHSLNKTNVRKLAEEHNKHRRIWNSKEYLFFLNKLRSVSNVM